MLFKNADRVDATKWNFAQILNTTLFVVLINCMFEEASCISLELL